MRQVMFVEVDGHVAVDHTGFTRVVIQGKKYACESISKHLTYICFVYCMRCIGARSFHSILPNPGRVAVGIDDAVPQLEVRVVRSPQVFGIRTKIQQSLGVLG